MTATPDNPFPNNFPAGVVVSDACSAFCPPGRKDCQITEDGVCDVRPCSAVLLAVHQICEDKWQAMVVVEHQTIGFGPLCDSEEECQWWCSQFKAAMSKAGARFISPNTVGQASPADHA